MTARFKSELRIVFCTGRGVFCEGNQALKATIPAAAEFAKGVVNAIQEAVEN